jgi:hypothetical protein
MESRIRSLAESGVLPDVRHACVWGLEERGQRRRTRGDGARRREGAARHVAAP